MGLFLEKVEEGMSEWVLEHRKRNKTFHEEELHGQRLRGTKEYNIIRE